MKKRICIIGLDQPIVDQIRKNYFGPVMYHVMVPKIFVEQGQLFVERSNGVGMLPVDKVIFHGIYENDFDIITGLSIWGGPCFPSAHAMLDCRLKLPCLARAMRMSRFNTKRGFLTAHTSIQVEGKRVGKWGNWHCGENKAIFSNRWEHSEAAIIEPFFEGDAVRVVSIGDAHLQIKLEGKDWLKSIHDESARIMPIDQDLLEDTLHIKKSMQMEMIANDYIVGTDGQKHLLEINHIPNVTRFDALQQIYLDEVVRWIN